LTAADGLSTTSSTLTSIGARLDHVAHAVPSIRAALPLYHDLLGGEPVSGGIAEWGGHATLHMRFADGQKIELIQAIRPDSPSVGKFLAEHPAGGLHHVTYRVHDIREALDVMTQGGYHPFGTRLEHESWQETFLHPKEAGGVLIQIVQAPQEVPGPLGMSVEELLTQAESLLAASLEEP
jgi:methylmalonyl-CoA/ethylmalonyl-CoA epimerase